MVKMRTTMRLKGSRRDLRVKGQSQSSIGSDPIPNVSDWKGMIMTNSSGSILLNIYSKILKRSESISFILYISEQIREELSILPGSLSD